MKKNIILTICFLCVLIPSTIYAQRYEINFNENWHFTSKDNPQYSNFCFDDNVWKEISIPHDWSFMKGISRDGAQLDGGGYFGGGIGWYRKTFEGSSEWNKKRVLIEFDGVYMNSDVWINGHYLGKRPYGYISFRYEISKYLNPGKNQIAVRVDNSKEPSTRWYHPCGIYAPVRLIVTGKQYIQPNGIYISSPVVGSEKATLKINTELFNGSDNNVKAILKTSVLEASGKEIKTAKTILKGGKSSQFKNEQTFTLNNPELWSPESPYLYTVVISLFVNEKMVDQVKTRYGIRKIEWKTDSGFWLNGNVCKLLGVSEHYEGGPVGGAWTKPLLRWKLNLLKEMGVNAIRTAHNPVPPMFYDLCDEMGIMVMDEIFDGWKQKAKMDYGARFFKDWWKTDITEWLKRDRNHASVIIYSLGNETDGEIGKSLVEKCHEIDPGRMVTSGYSASEYMDVFGVNGGSEKQSFYKQRRPDKPFLATEAPHTWQTRGYYRTKTWFRDGYPNERQQPFDLPDLTKNEIFHYEWASPDKWTNRKQHFNSSYDNAMVRICARKNWELLRDLPWYSGHFRWTGFDYYGEAGYVHGGWPFRLFMGGALDVAGFKKDLFYFYQSQWTKRPMVHILPNWTNPTMKKGTKIPVWVYSNCDEVELYLNGKFLGKDKPGTKWDEMQCEWMVPWEQGTILAKGYINGKQVTEEQLTTSSGPERIKLINDSEYIDISKNKTAIITTAVTDSLGVVYPYGENNIYYNITGARVISMENGDPVDTTKNVGENYRKAFMGLTRVFLKLDKNAKDINIIAGAILGEKRQITTDKVYIDVKQIAVSGNLKKSKCQIYYTLDGTEPTKGNLLYKGAFSIKEGTTVKAIVLQEGKMILNMQETFDKDQGLTWGEETGNFDNAGDLKGMRAVDADFSGASVKINNEIKYLDFNNKEGKIIWYQENDGSGGNFTLKISYASNDKKSTRPMDLFINNKKVATLDFECTNSWNSKWKQIITKQHLEAGANYIEFRTTGQSAPNILMLQTK